VKFRMEIPDKQASGTSNCVVSLCGERSKSQEGGCIGGAMCTLQR